MLGFQSDQTVGLCFHVVVDACFEGGLVTRRIVRLIRRKMPRT